MMRGVPPPELLQVRAAQLDPLERQQRAGRQPPGRSRPQGQHRQQGQRQERAPRPDPSCPSSPSSRAWRGRNHPCLPAKGTLRCEAETVSLWPGGCGLQAVIASRMSSGVKFFRCTPRNCG